MARMWIHLIRMRNDSLTPMIRSLLQQSAHDKRVQLPLLETTPPPVVGAKHVKNCQGLRLFQELIWGLFFVANSIGVWRCARVSLALFLMGRQAPMSSKEKVSGARFQRHFWNNSDQDFTTKISIRVNTMTMTIKPFDIEGVMCTQN